MNGTSTRHKTLTESQAARLEQVANSYHDVAERADKVLTCGYERGKNAGADTMPNRSALRSALSNATAARAVLDGSGDIDPPREEDEGDEDDEAEPGRFIDNSMENGFCLDSFDGMECGCRRIGLQMQRGRLRAIDVIIGCITTAWRPGADDFQSLHKTVSGKPR